MPGTAAIMPNTFGHGELLLALRLDCVRGQRPGHWRFWLRLDVSGISWQVLSVKNSNGLLGKRGTSFAMCSTSPLGSRELFALSPNAARLVVQTTTGYSQSCLA